MGVCVRPSAVGGGRTWPCSALSGCGGSTRKGFYFQGKLAGVAPKLDKQAPVLAGVAGAERGKGPCRDAPTISSRLFFFCHVFKRMLRA